MATPTINLSEFYPLVRPHTPGAAQPTMAQNLRKSAIEFCEKTRCWRHEVTVEVGEQNEAIVAPNNAAIHEIERAEFGGERLTPVEYDDFKLEEFEETGKPRLITQQRFNTVSILPFEAGTLTCSTFLKPAHGQDYAAGSGAGPENAFDAVPDFLLSRYGETIAAGAIARILMLPGQPFSNPQLAPVHAAQFREGIDRFMAANVRGQHRARPRTNFSFM